MPIVIFIASFFTILYYLGIMQRVVQVFAVVMTKLLRISGAESLAVAANIFIGQTEAPIIVAPYIPKMTKSELMTMMTGGMAHISGAVLLAYAAMGIPAELPDHRVRHGRPGHDRHRQAPPSRGRGAGHGGRRDT